MKLQKIQTMIFLKVIKNLLINPTFIKFGLLVYFILNYISGIIGIIRYDGHILNTIVDIISIFFGSLVFDFWTLLIPYSGFRLDALLLFTALIVISILMYIIRNFKSISKNKFIKYSLWIILIVRILYLFFSLISIYALKDLQF